MYYSSIGILAFLILIFDNFNILKTSPEKTKSPSHKAYKTFLLGVMGYYITDVLWEPLYALRLTTLVFIETGIYFAIMGLSVFLWTKYIIIYLGKKDRFELFLKYCGRLLLAVQIIILIINSFVPIAYWFDELGIYQTGVARHVNLLMQLIMFLIVVIYVFITLPKSSGSLKRRYSAIGTFSLIMIVFIVLQSLFPLMPFYAAGYMLGTCLLHTFVLEDEKEVRRIELENLMKVEQIQEVELGTTRRLAYSDPLTGVKNKMAYIDDVNGIDQRISDNFLTDFALVVFDVNDLKKVNDTKGHEAGDQYIKNASTIICNKFKHSPVYRIGGDEFVTFLSGEDFTNCKKLLKEFNEEIHENLKNGDIVISSGFAEFNQQKDKSYLHLFDRADKNMYKCKQKLKALKEQH